ncbi:MAG: hypothetical protein IJX25_01645, partial [Clostridia bacterium]|nr:hypothetical protein [Clostridia bacterium]
MQTKCACVSETAPRLNGFADTHAHLTDIMFDGEYAEIVAKAKDCGVNLIITSGYDLESSKEAVAMAE